MRVALLVGVLMVNMVVVAYRAGLDVTGISQGSGQVSSGQVNTMDDGWPPPPPSFP